MGAEPFADAMWPFKTNGRCSKILRAWNIDLEGNGMSYANSVGGYTHGTLTVAIEHAEERGSHSAHQAPPSHQSGSTGAQGGPLAIGPVPP